MISKKTVQFSIIAVFCLFSTIIMLIPVNADLPDRDLPPTPIAEKSAHKEGATPTGAYIELHSAVNGWSVVQWQDSTGNWQIVDGWQGTVSGGVTAWWVEQKDFGTGPFRWAILSAPGGALIGVSEPFNLPNQAGTVAKIAVLKQ